MRGHMGCSEILYAFTSGPETTDRLSAGLRQIRSGTTRRAAMAMLVGRFFMIIPMLAIAGNLARKKYVPPSLGTFPGDDATVHGLLVGVIVIVGALTFFPALSLGPILEHLLMQAGQTLLRTLWHVCKKSRADLGMKIVTGARSGIHRETRSTQDDG